MISSTPPPVLPYSPLASSAENTAEPTQALSRSRRNIGEPAKYWPQNSTIKIAMYEYDMNDEYVLAVKKAASEWLPHINLKFEFVPGDEGDVRITQNMLDDQSGTSAVGTDALDDPYNPTMSLPKDHRHPRFQYVVMHEFGHMLGAHHAHQHADANIPWDMDKVHEEYKRIHGMDRKRVQNDVLPLPRSSQYDYQPYDGDSIMHYEISPRLTHGEWAQSETWSLSEGDIAWAKKAYPKSTTAIS